MELRHLRYFKAVAETLNFSRASESLRVAQPALSRQVRALETELGVELFDRDRGVRLTDAGRIFYAQVCKVLSQVDIAVASVQQAAGDRGGELILCNDWRLAGHFVPEVVAEFQEAFPRAEVTLRDLRFHDQLAALRARRAHLGFVVRSVLGRLGELETLLVLRARLMIVLPAKHPLAERTEIQLADLANETWLSIDEKEAPGYRAFLLQLCRLSGFVPKLGKSAATPEGVIGRVASGYGIALSLESNAPHNNPLVRVRPTNAEPVEFCAVWHRREKSPLLQSFLRILERHAARETATDKLPAPPPALSAVPAPTHKKARAARRRPQT